MDLMFTPVLVRCFLNSLVLSGPMTKHFLDSCMATTKVFLKGVAHLRLLTHPTTLPFTHPIIHAIHDITVVVKKVAQNPAVLASY